MRQPPCASGTKPDARRVFPCPTPSAGNAGQLPACARVEPEPSKACSGSSGSRDHIVSRSPLLRSSTGKEKVGSLPQSSFPVSLHWTSVPLSGETSICGTMPQMRRPRETAKSFSPGPSVCRGIFFYLIPLAKVYQPEGGGIPAILEAAAAVIKSGVGQICRAAQWGISGE